MKSILKTAAIKVSPEKYLSMLIVMIPLLNFLSGITFDLHAPSLPAISAYFSAPISAAKDTITISLFGFSAGCIVFGNLLDVFGRKPVIFVGFLIYIISSFFALSCHTMNALLVVRLLQGFSVSALSIGCRTIILDNFTDHQFKVAMLYSSLAFGIGPVIAPFFGGILQYHFGWKSNFIVYGVVSFVLMVIFMLLVNESQQSNLKFSIQNIISHYKAILSQNVFVFGFLICGISQIQLMVYTTTGSFIIEHVFHRTAITYGNSALLVSCGYLFGTLTNRLMIKHFLIHKLIQFGFVLLFFAMMLQLVFSIFNLFNLLTLILPIALIGFANGFVFMNIFSACLSMKKTAAGITTALFTSAFLLIGSIGIGVVSHIPTVSLSDLFLIFFVPFIFQSFIFVKFLRKKLAYM